MLIKHIGEIKTFKNQLCIPKEFLNKVWLTL